MVFFICKGKRAIEHFQQMNKIAILQFCLIFRLTKNINLSPKNNRKEASNIIPKKQKNILHKTQIKKLRDKTLNLVRLCSCVKAIQRNISK